MKKLTICRRTLNFNDFLTIILCNISLICNSVLRSVAWSLIDLRNNIHLTLPYLTSLSLVRPIFTVRQDSRPTNLQGQEHTHSLAHFLNNSAPPERDGKIYTHYDKLGQQLLTLSLSLLFRASNSRQGLEWAHFCRQPQLLLRSGLMLAICPHVLRRDSSPQREKYFYFSFLYFRFCSHLIYRF